MDLDPEVRKCSSCGAAAMVCVSRYQRSRVSIIGGITDWVCQRCGHPVTLHAIPWLFVPVAVISLPLLPLGIGAATWAIGAGEILALLIMSGPMIALPLGLSGAVLWPWWTARRHPIVPDAPRPELRHRDTQPRRRCGCLGTARCIEITANRTNGIYTGTEYEYRCEKCERTFTVESPLSMAFTLAAGIFLATLTVFLWPASVLDASWTDLAIVGVLGLLGVLTLGITASRVLARVRHPVIGLGPR